MATTTPTRSTDPNERLKLRKSLYKSKPGNVEWKETYRQRCSKRLQASREKRIDQCRKGVELGSGDVIDTVYNVMQEEWDNLRSEVQLPSLLVCGQKRTSTSPIDSSTGHKRLLIDDMHTPERGQCCHGYQWSSPDNSCIEDIDSILEVMDSITRELIREEQEILAQYEDSQHFTEKAITAAIESLQTDDVVCPLCLKNVLCQTNEIIHCQCGLSIDTAQDGITLDYVRQQLNDATTQHSQSCLSHPVFSVQNCMGMTNIVMSCQHCDILYIIV